MRRRTTTADRAEPLPGNAFRHREADLCRNKKNPRTGGSWGYFLPEDKAGLSGARRLRLIDQRLERVRLAHR